MVSFINIENANRVEDSIVSDGDNYNIESAMLVRTTDGFPFDGTVLTPEHANVVISDLPTTMHYIIVDMLREKYGDQFEKYLNDFNIKQIEKRHTIHFCINGLVSDHEYGEFQGRKYIIVEPLKYHLDEIKSLRVEDTYFDDDVVLSSEAVVLMPVQEYERIKNNFDYIKEFDRFKVVVYNGDPLLAVQNVLNSLGYDSFLINKHGYTNGFKSDMSASKMYKMICNYAINNNISVDRHLGSADSRIDNKKILDDDIIIESELIDVMISKLGKDEKLSNYLKSELGNSFPDSDYKDKLTQLIKEFGLENLSNEIAVYNAKFEESLNIKNKKM